MSDWIEFLTRKNALGPILSAPESVPCVSPSQTLIVPLVHQGLLSIQGPDAVKFLQGQLTCDLRELAEPVTRLGAQCNLKGRMLLAFRALQANAEQVYLRVHTELVSSGLANLGKYAVFSKVKLSDASPSFRAVGVVGAQAQALIKRTFALELTQDDQWAAQRGHLIIRLSQDRYECWLDSAEAESIWDQLSDQSRVADQNYWKLLNIQAGLGDISSVTVDKFTPQGLNFQLINGINFRKGCYTGQEIIARLHYRGTLKRHMFRFEFNHNGEPLPIPGSDLVDATGKNIGELVLAAYKSANRGELLANLIDSAVEDAHLVNIPQKLRPLELPYAIPTASETE